MKTALRVLTLLDEISLYRGLARQAEKELDHVLSLPDRVRYTIVVEKDVTKSAPQSEVEAMFARRIGDKATVEIESYEYL